MKQITDGLTENASTVFQYFGADIGSRTSWTSSVVIAMLFKEAPEGSQGIIDWLIDSLSFKTE